MIAGQSPAETVPKKTRWARVGEFVSKRYLEADLRWLGVFRILFGLLLLSELLNRWRYARLFFSNDGVLPNHYSIFSPMGEDLFSIYHAFSTVGEVRVAFALTLLVFASFTCGYKTRLTHALSLVCIVHLHTRNLFLENGGGVVLHLLGLWTLFLPLGERFSIDALRKARRAGVAAPTGPSSAPVVTSVAVLALKLQWAVIYFFNAVHKDGAGWRDGTALHWFLHQDRIVTSFGIWAREHFSLWLIQKLTFATLAVELALPLLLLIPLPRRYCVRVALFLAIGLHGSIALFSRLGPFSYAMLIAFAVFLAPSEWALMSRYVTLARERLRALSAELRQAAARGSAVARALTAPIWLFDTGSGRTALALGNLRRSVSRLSAPLSAASPLHPAGDPVMPKADTAADPAAPPPADPPSQPTLVAAHGARLLTVTREWAVLVCLMVLGTQAMRDNRFWTQHLPVSSRPSWFSNFVNYGRFYQGWGMFAPEPPYDDGRLVVDGRTRDGRKLDPFTGAAPSFETETREGWGHDQLWCDYNNHVRFPHHEHRREFLRAYLQRQHVYSGRPEDELVAFDVWWVQDRSPPPGKLQGVPLKPDRLLRHGNVTDSGARPAR